mgnify:FL=1
MGFRPKDVRLKKVVLSLGMKKDDSRKEVLPFGPNKKPSGKGTVKDRKTLHGVDNQMMRNDINPPLWTETLRTVVGAKI